MLASCVILTLLLTSSPECSALCSVSSRGVAIVPNGNMVIYGGSRFVCSSGAEEEYTITIMSLTEESKSIIWDIRKGTGSRIEQLACAPVMGFVSFLELVPDPKNEGVGANWTLRILTLEGKQVVELPGVCIYAWSPDGSRIAAIEGWYIDSGARFHPKGAYIYDIKTGARVNIPGGYRDVRWPGFDEDLYLEIIPVIYRWRDGMTQPEKTEYHGLEFSVGGTYYCKSEGEPQVSVYMRSTNELVTGGNSCQFSDPLLELLRPVQWLSDSLLLLDSRAYEIRRDYLLNVITGECRKIPLPVVAGRQDDGTILTYDQDKGSFETHCVSSWPTVTGVDIAATESEGRHGQ